MDEIQNIPESQKPLTQSKKLDFVRAFKNSQNQVTALKRSAGALLDFGAIGIVALLPCIFRVVSRQPIPDNIIAAILADNFLFWCTCLALSPLPLGYLRVVFHRLLRSPTPGEMFANITTLGLLPGLSGLIVESCYALVQYVCLLVVFLPALICGLFAQNYLLVPLLGNTLVVSLTTISSMALIMSIFYWPKDESNASFIDEACSTVTKRLTDG